MTYSQSPRSRGARLAVLLPVLAGSLLAYSAARAQSTGSQEVEAVVVTAKHAANVDGLITLQEAPKTKSVITQAYISTQQPGQNVIQLLNQTPGLNFTNDDPYGMSGGGGHLRLRGIDGSRVSLLVDGVPLNDTGNYAIYAGELVDPEIVSQVNVNVGSTDVDSPTASAVGGLINIRTLTPTDTPQGFVNGTVGSYDYRRIAGLVNTGEFGPLGTKAWFEASDQEYNKYKGFGEFKKWQINGKVYQPLWHDGDFVAVAFLYDSQRQPNIYGLDFATFNSVKGTTTVADPFGTDYLGTYFFTGPTPGNAGSDATPTNAPTPAFLPPSGGFNGNLGKYFYGNQVNPTDTYDVRGESSFTLLPNVHLTVDPAFQSVLADGGSQANTISESDPRLIGTATTFKCPAGQKGVDLNGDGDCLDTVRVFLPSLTHTERITVNTSLIWNINSDNLIRLAYAYDHGHHRQIGEAGYLLPDGFPASVFGGYDSTPVLAADGSALRNRDRLSIAVLNQYSAEYVGRFFNEKLQIDLGVRDPRFSRDLNQYCYTSVTSGSGVYCDTATPPPTGSTAQYSIAPFHAHVSYTKVLPNVGVSFHFDPANMIYASYSEELSAPRTDDLYTVSNSAGSVTLDTVAPETSTNYEVGYRFQRSDILASVALWDSEFQNRIVSSYDPNTNLTIDRNVGNVRLYGVDAQIGAKPIEHLSTTAFFGYEHSRLEQNIVYDKAGDIEPLAGKALVETPEIELGGRVQYEFFPGATIGLQGKYVGSRWVTDVNDLKVAGYTTFDLDMRYDLSHFFPRSYIQFNATNILNKRYYGSLNSAGSIDTGKPWGGTPYADQGAPRTATITLRAAF
jgi:iron complex outermembrane receptor protein